SSLTEEEKSELTDRLTEQVNNITAESELETQIKAKGFADCVVFLNEGKANITVMTENDALTSEEVTQIRDVVLRKCSGLSAQDITVVEVK
ncbi:MAG: SpoIIIAH-like family protein, partial [Gemmiger sp.]